MIDGTVVKEIDRISREAQGIADKVTTINGAEFSTVQLHQVPQPKAPEPSPIVVHTLTGFADYIRANRDSLALGESLIHVEGHNKVALRSRLQEPSQQRFAYVVADLLPRADFRFGEFMDVEQFVIKLQSQFENVGDRADVLRIAGTVKAEAVMTRNDDGVTQKVVASEGVILDRIDVPNPVSLAPFRTFVEVEQPSSPFVFRLKLSGTSIVATLLEADGGAWKIEAIKRIAEWLRAANLDVAIVA